MKPGDLCEVKVDFLNEKHDFVGILLEVTDKKIPWFNLRFLQNDAVKELRLMKSEIEKSVKVVT